MVEKPEGRVIVADLPFEVLDAIAAGSGCGLVVLDAEERIEYWSSQFTELTGIGAEQVVGRPWGGLMLPFGIVETPEGSGSRLVAAAEALSGIVFQEVTDPVSRRIGVLHLHSVKMDGDEAAVKPEFALETATGIPSRKALRVQLQQLLAYQKRYRSIFSMLLIKIRNSRDFIETLGSDQWDFAVKTLYDQLCAYVRMSDSVGLYQEDTFWIILTNSAVGGSLVVADKLKRLVGNVQLDEIEEKFDVIVGGVMAQSGVSPDELVTWGLEELRKAEKDITGISLKE